MKTNADSKVLEHAIDKLKDGISDINASDLHHVLYNEDYFIIGTWEAKQFLNEIGTFEAIEIVQEYEQSNFGEVNTDLSDPEKVVNMYAYIKGEEFMNNCKTLQSKWDKNLDDDDIQEIIKELEAQL